MQEDAPLSARFTSAQIAQGAQPEEVTAAPPAESDVAKEVDPPAAGAEGQEMIGSSESQSDRSPVDVVEEMRYVKEELKSLRRADALENALSAVRDELRLLRRERDSGKGTKPASWSSMTTNTFASRSPGALSS
jgi:hypothetical protein